MSDSDNIRQREIEQHKKKKSKVERAKEETMALYAQLPQDRDVPGGDAEEARKARLDIRDKIIELNYPFFGFIAKRTTVHNTCISFEDKMQSALSQFMQCWWRYQWEGHYRCDISFSVFFTLRLSEMVDRELTQVKYSVYKSLQEEVGNILGKAWSEVTYDDLSDPRLVGKVSVAHIESLKVIFGAMYEADLETHSIFIPAEDDGSDLTSIENLEDDTNYNSVTDLLVREMIDRESKLDKKAIRSISDMYGIDEVELKEALPEAEIKLYKIIQDKLAIQGHDKNFTHSEAYSFKILPYDKWPYQFKKPDFDYFKDNQEEIGHIDGYYRCFQFEYRDKDRKLRWSNPIFLSKLLIYADNELYEAIRELQKHGNTYTGNLIFRGYYQQRISPDFPSQKSRRKKVEELIETFAFTTFYRIDYELYYDLMDKYEGKIKSEFKQASLKE